MAAESGASANRLAPDRNGTRAWGVLWSAALVGFLVSAALNLARVRGGFATNHLADVSVPAWLYLSTRDPRRTGTRLQQWLGASPARAAVLLWAASTATELSQWFWPHGVFSGRFDPLDIGAYAAGILPCYAYDRWLGHRSRSPADVARFLHDP